MEVLVVTIIIGVLAAIALPAFTSQTQKADDAAAKALVANGAVAMQTLSVEHDGYAVSRQELLKAAPELADARTWSIDADAGQFTLSVTATSQHVYSIQRDLAGAARRTCTLAGSGGCPPSGLW